MYSNALGQTLLLSGAAQNWVGGAPGPETLYGTSRNDFIYDSGPDQLYGGLGDDTYHLWDAGSRVHEAANAGIDTVISYMFGKATLSANVENLFLAGFGSNAGEGNDLDNILQAGDRAAALNGKGGNDVLISGAGADLFLFEAGNGSDKIYGFQPGFDAIRLTGYGINSFTQLQAMASQVGADVRIALPNGEALVMADTTVAALSAFDFTLPMPPLTAGPGEQLLSGAGAVYTTGGWYVLNNVWNPGTLVEGQDYSVASTYRPGAPNEDVTFQWSFPFAAETFPNVKAYPEVIFGPAPMSGGQKPTDVGGVFPVQVSDIDSLTLDYAVDYTGNTGGFNVAFDIWFTSQPGGGADTLTNELMIWIHKGDFEAFGELIGRYEGADFSADIYHTGTYTALVMDEDRPSGEIDLDAVMDHLIGLGIMSEDEYLASVELGAEVSFGAGSLTIEHLDIELDEGDALIPAPEFDSEIVDAVGALAGATLADAGAILAPVLDIGGPLWDPIGVDPMLI